MRTPWSTTEWRRVLVYGLGLSGRAATRLLLRNGVRVLAVDRRHEEELGLDSVDGGSLSKAEGLSFVPEDRLLSLPQNLDGVVVSPGVPSERPLLKAARAAGLPVISEVELAFPFLNGPVIGITGTNGKSTTTELTGAMLRAAGLEVEVCGNIGQPVSDRVDGSVGRHFVIELSSYQLENLETFRARAAAILNIAPDHLDRYPSLESYAEAKARIFDRQDESDVAVLNGDDGFVRRMTGGLRARRRFFSRKGAVDDGCCLEGDRIIEISPGLAPRVLFAAADLALDGSHNLENAMAAALLARSVGVEPPQLVRALKAFEALPHRMQPVAEVGGVRYFDDSKGTNVAATAKSLDGLEDGRVHLILGGQHKGDDLEPLRALIRRKVKALYLIGAAERFFAEAFDGETAVERVGTLDNAVSLAAQRALPDDVVLLSPACASFDQFQSYAHRGRRFQGLVQDLERTVGEPESEVTHG